jgi:hypothetical protein
MKLLAIWCFLLTPFYHPHFSSFDEVDFCNPLQKKLYAPSVANTPTNSQYNLQSTFNQALKIVKSSSHFLKLSRNNQHKPVVSCQQISWGIYQFFFEDPIRGIIGNRKPEFEKVQDEHLKPMPLFKKLAAAPNGKILISFSAIYDRIFFAEMTLLSNVGDCQATRPVLNEVYVYMFHIKENDDISLVSVKRLD